MFWQSPWTTAKVLRLGERADPGTGNYILAVPGDAAPLLHLDLPTGVTGAARLRVARRALSDRLGPLADDLDLFPFQAGAAKASRWRAMIAPDQARLAHWRTEAAAQDPRCLAVLPDFLTLPAADTLVVVDATDGRHVMARVGLGDGFSAPREMAHLALEAALRTAAMPKPVSALAFGPIPDACREVLASHEVEVVAADSPEAQPLRAIARPYCAGERAVDLRRPSGAGEARTGLDLGLVAGTLITSAAAFVIWCATALTETRAIEQSTTEIRQRTEAMLRQGLIPEGPILDIRKQVTARLSAQTPDGEGATDPVDMIYRVTAVLGAQNVTVKTITLGEGPELGLSFLTDDFARLDVIEDALRATGLVVQRDMARALDPIGVEARLTVGREASLPVTPN